MRSNYRGPLYLSAAAVIWGGMYVASKYVLDVVPPFTLLFIRYLLAFFTLLVWCRWSGVAIVPGQDKWILFQIGFFGYFLSIAAQFIGTQLSSAHIGAVITTLSPVFQSAFAIALLDEKITRKQILAIGLSFAGVLVITGIPGFDEQAPNSLGHWFFMAAACLWGYYSVLVKKVAERHSTLQITTWGILLAAIFAIFPAWREWNTWDIEVLASLPVLSGIGYVAIISTTIAYFCWNKGLTLLNSHQAGLFFFLQPVAGSILGYLILGEALTLPFFLGSLFILFGVYMVL